MFSANQAILQVAYKWEQLAPVVDKHNWSAIACNSDGSVVFTFQQDGNHGYVSTDSGVNWTKTINNNHPQGILSGLDMSSDGAKMWAVESGNGDIYYSNDSGATWTQKLDILGNGYYDLACSADGAIIVSPRRLGLLSRSVDTGANWTTTIDMDPSSGPSLDSWVGICCSSDGSIMYGVRANAGLKAVKSTDSGATWSVMSAAPIMGHAACHCSDDGSVVAILQATGYIYLSRDAGASWVQQVTPVETWSKVKVSGDGRIIIACSADVLYVYSYLDGIWVAQTTDPPGIGKNYWSHVAIDSDGSHIYACVYDSSVSGYVYRGLRVS